MIGRRNKKVRYGRLISYKKKFHSGLVSSLAMLFSFVSKLFASAIGGSVIILQVCVIESSNHLIHASPLLLTFFVMFHSPLTIVLQLPSFLVLQNNVYDLGWVSSSFFICNFCKFEWWSNAHLATPNVVASFISNLV